MTTPNPITPPSGLAQQWLLEAHHKEAPPGTCPDTRILITRAAQWGADQELEACCEWLPDVGEMRAMLRAARRPKPISKAEALRIIDENIVDSPRNIQFALEEIKTIRRALEALDD